MRLLKRLLNNDFGTALNIAEQYEDVQYLCIFFFMDKSQQIFEKNNMNE